MRIAATARVPGTRRDHAEEGRGEGADATGILRYNTQASVYDKRSRKTVFKERLICRDARISLSLPAALSRAREIGRLAAWAVPWAIAHREDHQSCRRGHRGVRLAFIRSFRGGAPACCRVGALRVSYRQSGKTARLSKRIRVLGKGLLTFLIVECCE